MIQITNLTKSFYDNIVIDRLNLTVTDGEITALVGKNGAGKSTLIRLIAGLLRPDSGRVKINDNEQVGVMLGGDISFYRNLTAYEIIYFFGRLRGLDDGYIEKRINDLNPILNIKNFADKRAYTFSRGMTQKVGLALTVLHNPDILLLDEPSTGMDIESSDNVIEFIRCLKYEKKTILIATHNIFEISDLSDNIAFLNNGQILQKVNTNLFFQDCPNDKKSERLIQTIQGD